LLLHEKGGAAALSGTHGERATRAAEVTGGARTLNGEPPRRGRERRPSSAASILPAFWDA